MVSSFLGSHVFAGTFKLIVRPETGIRQEGETWELSMLYLGTYD